MRLNPILTAQGKDGQPIIWQDWKRFFWPLPILNLSIPILAAWFYFQLDRNPWLTLIPVIYLFVVIPLLDKLIGHDTHNPPEEVVPALSADIYYRIVGWVMISLHFILIPATLWFLTSQSLPLWSIAAILIGVGTMNGGAIILAHELGHHSSKIDHIFAQIALASIGYGHFTSDHNRGHHVHVATPEDCASARMGESVYQFAWRELPGAFMRGWSFEAERLRRRGLPAFHWRNEILQSYALTLLFSAAIILWLGWSALPLLLVHNFISWYGLTQVNYIEHYGLLRQRKDNGRYEPCHPKHSWNANHLFSNLLQLHLQRHSDHHANPARPYQALRDHRDAPQLPTGYPGCLALAAFPPIWFTLMDKRVVEWAGGDLSKINMHPPARKKIERQFG
ncbi:MAG: alkane 1-monooxygenase [bacterium]